MVWWCVRGISIDHDQNAYVAQDLTWHPRHCTDATCTLGQEPSMHAATAARIACSCLRATYVHARRRQAALQVGMAGRAWKQQTKLQVGRYVATTSM